MTPRLAGLELEGKYRLGEAIGSGGMGVVYAAEHIRLGRPLAVKLLRPELAGDPLALQRFQQEAVAASRIGNPHIVDVLDLGNAPGGAPFLVMELLQGRSLADELARTPVLPTPRAAEIVCQMLDGLGAAHAQGIVHRDLKPENVFLVPGPDGRDFVKLLDFGVSKVRTETQVTQLTQTGAVLGTPRYMAPEQAAGERDVDLRADLWAVGVILFRMLAGRHPYDADNYNALLASILMRDAPRLRSLRPDLDPGLEAILQRVLARDRELRFPAADPLRAALLPYTGAPSGAWRLPPPGPPPPATPPTPWGLPGATPVSGWGPPAGSTPGSVSGTPAGTPFAAAPPPPRSSAGLAAAVVLASLVLAAGGIGIYVLATRDRGEASARPAAAAGPATVASGTDAPPPRTLFSPPDPAETAAAPSAVAPVPGGVAGADAVPVDTPSPLVAPPPPSADAASLADPWALPPLPPPNTGDPERDRYVAIATEIACVSARAALIDPENFDPTLGFRASQQILARHDLGGMAWGELQARYAPDGESFRMVQDRTMLCINDLVEAQMREAMAE